MNKPKVVAVVGTNASGKSALGVRLAGTFDGEIIVIDHEDKVDAAVDDLSSYPYIGFDTETKPAFKKGVTHQVGLLQLATDKRVYLFRLNKCGLSESLQDLWPMKI